MDVADYVVNNELLRDLVECGRQAHLISQAHNNDPGSNGFTFGTDRYQRATQLAMDPLSADGFHVTRRGAGLIASRDGIELHFAVARGNDLRDPADFEAGSSPARRRAAEQNGQTVLDGMPEPPAAPVLHLVWSGNPENGQTAVHIGRLVVGAGDRLDWAVLLRVDTAVATTAAADPTAAAAVPSYTDQPLPPVVLAPRTTSTSGTADGDEA